MLRFEKKFLYYQTCLLHFKNDFCSIECVRFASEKICLLSIECVHFTVISKKTPLSKLLFAFVLISLPLLLRRRLDPRGGTRLTRNLVMLCGSILKSTCYGIYCTKSFHTPSAQHKHLSLVGGCVRDPVGGREICAPCRKYFSLQSQLDESKKSLVFL